MRKFFFRSFVVILLLLVTPGWAGLFDPAVGNPSFEDVVLPNENGEWDYFVGEPWGEIGFRYLESNVASGWAGVDPTPYGNNSVRIGGGGAVYIEIGTWEPETDYDVTIWIAQRGDAPSWIVGELWGGGQSGFAATDVDLWDNPGAVWLDWHWFNVADLGGPTSGDVSWTFNSSANNAGGLVPGDPLWVRFAPDAGVDMQIDNIRVVPEPATVLLMALGGLSLLRYRKSD
jgi:hypothetical protein